MKKQRNRNYQRIDNAIINAYKEILKDKGESDPSITELCKKAKVNRTTFYKHYHGVYEIIDRIEQEIIYSLFNLNHNDKLGMKRFLNNPRPTLDILNANLSKNLAYYKSILRPERMHYIIDKCTILLLDDFKKEYPKYTRNTKAMVKVKINIANLVGSFAGLYLQWINGHLDCKIEDIAIYLDKVLQTVYKNAKFPE